MTKQFLVVSYDISNDKRRSKAAKTLEDFGTRVQYSVFEALMSAALAEEMEERITGAISREEDSIRVYRLCEECRRNVRILGQGERTVERKIIVV